MLRFFINEQASQTSPAKRTGECAYCVRAQTYGEVLNWYRTFNQ
ncbi:hypothetical protein COLSTE_00272 [Collinsella stercoris DSM 13279]|uniref:Uncharacterized protein n=1 Tax=Collinsella stercoris DSM 13279 TaxID=445975 RepID=B6G882_9ACTN|nr:hypothetical protein COLSTE_00272 [Collinsella stercoris DSM 13279]